MYTKELEVAKGIAYEAGKMMRGYFDSDLGIERKSDASLVTVADKEINHFVIQELLKNFDDIIVGEEESTGEYGTGRRWLCDPIDGTKAFVWGVPTAMFSLALVVDGVPVVGVAYDPFMDKLFYAVKDCGAFCNDKKIMVNKNGLKDGFINITSNINSLTHAIGQISGLMEQGAIPALYSGAVHKSCSVASGRFVGYVDSTPCNYDVAAVAVIVLEAGGKITAIDGSVLDFSKKFQGVVVSNGIVHNEMVSAFN